MGLNPGMWRADAMLKRRRQYSARFKFQVAFEELMGTEDDQSVGRRTSGSSQSDHEMETPAA